MFEDLLLDRLAVDQGAAATMVHYLQVTILTLRDGAVASRHAGIGYDDLASQASSDHHGPVGEHYS